MSKNRPGRFLLTETLRNPERAKTLQKIEWEQLIWQSRAAELMAQLHQVLFCANMLQLAPVEAQRHLAAAWTISGRHVSAIHAELRGLQQVLEPVGVPVLLLKGAAYCVLGNRASHGRIFSDIDIMVPKEALGSVEERLSWAGWISQNTNVYDERYYRNWMHEIPPLEHKHRGTVLDVHHTILPPVSGIRPNPQELILSSVSAPSIWKFFRVLSGVDRVIHSACHLFFGEFHKGLRDLYDLHCMLSEADKDQQFWPALVERATHHRLSLPLLDALQHCKRVYGTAIPDEVLGNLQSAAQSRWPAVARHWMFDHALRPAHASSQDWSTGFALKMVFVRSHWLRMPLPLLIYHLSHKAFVVR